MTVLGDPLYADTSALVKLIIDENESESLARYVSESDLQLTSSVIAEGELLRAVKRVERGRLDEAQQLPGREHRAGIAGQFGCDSSGDRHRDPG